VKTVKERMMLGVGPWFLCPKCATKAQCHIPEGMALVIDSPLIHIAPELLSAARELAEEVDKQSDRWVKGSYVDFAAVVDACRPLRKVLGVKSARWGDDE
jgi:hypothetical protein